MLRDKNMRYKPNSPCQPWTAWSLKPTFPIRTSDKDSQIQLLYLHLHFQPHHLVHWDPGLGLCGAWSKSNLRDTRVSPLPMSAHLASTSLIASVALIWFCLDSEPRTSGPKQEIQEGTSRSSAPASLTLSYPWLLLVPGISWCTLRTWIRDN